VWIVHLDKFSTSDDQMEEAQQVRHRTLKIDEQTSACITRAQVVDMRAEAAAR
jgi:hypothetical protein